MKGVILAGGTGTRLWPASRDDLPKQFLSLTGEHSLLPVRALTTLREKVAPADEPSASQLRWSHGRAFTGLVLGALRADNWVSRTSARLGIRLPGLSTWALCRAAS